VLNAIFGLYFKLGRCVQYTGMEPLVCKKRTYMYII